MNLDDLRTSRSAVVTVSEAASVFGVDVHTVTRAIENGELQAVRLGRRLLIPRLPLLVALGVEVDEARPEVPDTGAGDRRARDPASCVQPLPRVSAAAASTSAAHVVVRVARRSSTLAGEGVVPTEVPPRFRPAP